MSVFAAENIRDWRTREVVDPGGSRIGTLEAVYVDTATDEPSFATVQVGRLRNKRLVLVPLDGATVSPEHVRVRHDRRTVRDAPAIALDGELPAGTEPDVFAHYGLSYAPGASGERRLARR